MRLYMNDELNKNL